MNRFAIQTPLGTCLTAIALVLAFCCTHRVWVAWCLSCPKPERDAIPRAALESIQAHTGNSSSTSFIRDRCLSPAPAAFARPQNSALPGDRDADGCIELRPLPLPPFRGCLRDGSHNCWFPSQCSESEISMHDGTPFFSRSLYFN